MVIILNESFSTSKPEGYKTPTIPLFFDNVIYGLTSFLWIAENSAAVCSPF